MQYIDTHAHFDLCAESYHDFEKEIMNTLTTARIVNAVHINIDPKKFSWSYDFALQHKTKGIFFTLGIHPSSQAIKSEIEEMEKFTSTIINSNNADLLFGIGETGLDYYRMRQPKEAQLELFEAQIEIAKKYHLPLIVHSRDAAEDCLMILKKYAPIVGIMHCFSEGVDYAKKFLDIGMYISFAGNVTYNTAHILRESAAYVPLERLFLETDAPFLAPVPLRGKKNLPHFICHTYKFIAQLRKISAEKLSQHIMENFQKILAHRFYHKEVR